MLLISAKENPQLLESHHSMLSSIIKTTIPTVSHIQMQKGSYLQALKNCDNMPESRSIAGKCHLKIYVVSLPQHLVLGRETTEAESFNNTKNMFHDAVYEMDSGPSPVTHLTLETYTWVVDWFNLISYPIAMVKSGPVNFYASQTFLKHSTICQALAGFQSHRAKCGGRYTAHFSRHNGIGAKWLGRCVWDRPLVHNQ